MQLHKCFGSVDSKVSTNNLSRKETDFIKFFGQMSYSFFFCNTSSQNQYPHTVKSQVLTRLVQKHMQAFSDCLLMTFLTLIYCDLFLITLGTQMFYPGGFWLETRLIILANQQSLTCCQIHFRSEFMQVFKYKIPRYLPKIKVLL